MNNAAWRRKLIYMCIMGLMLFPLYLLGQPATGGGGDAGGSLARLRDTYNIAEANLGEIDPASESMKLATLGMRGVAATVLWKKQDEYRKHQEWDRVSATLQQIALLQPHFENVWEHQAHNLAYNISSEFDDYRQRYAWVKKGIKFLIRGVKLNRREPRLIWQTGWFFGSKLGLSDEKIQFRELFRDDVEFHKDIQRDDPIDIESQDAKGPDGKPDNWLVGRLWLNYGYDIVDAGTPLINKTPLTFFEVGPKWRIKHGVSIEEEGTIDDDAKEAWRLAEKDWVVYGEREIPTLDGYTVQLGGLESADQLMRDITDKFDQLSDVRTTHLDTAIQALPEDVREAFDTAFDERTPKQHELVIQNRERLAVSMKSLARSEGMPDEKKMTALRLAESYEEADRRARKVRGYRNQMNYSYWDTRCDAEQEADTILARRLLYDAEALLDDALLDEALAKFEEAFEVWERVFRKYPILVSDAGADDITESIARYSRMLDEPELPQDFPLMTFLESREFGPPSAAEYLRMVEEQDKLAAQEASESETKDGDSEEQKEDEASGEDAKEEMKADDKEADDKEADDKEADDKEADDKEADDEKADDKKADDKKADDEKADDEKADDEKADDEKADDEKADDEKADDEKADDKKADDKKADDKKADDKKADDKKADDKKADDKKADDKKADDKKADDKKADDKKADDKKADDKKADDKKADDKKADDKKADDKKADDKKADDKKADDKKADDKKADDKKADDKKADDKKADDNVEAPDAEDPPSSESEAKDVPAEGTETPSGDSPGDAGKTE